MYDALLVIQIAITHLIREKKTGNELEKTEHWKLFNFLFSSSLSCEVKMPNCQLSAIVHSQKI